jgi:hypothetical protein
LRISLMTLARRKGTWLDERFETRTGWEPEKCAAGAMFIGCPAWAVMGLRLWQTRFSHCLYGNLFVGFVCRKISPPNHEQCLFLRHKRCSWMIFRDSIINAKVGWGQCLRAAGDSVAYDPQSPTGTEMIGRCWQKTADPGPVPCLGMRTRPRASELRRCPA